MNRPEPRLLARLLLAAALVCAGAAASAAAQPEPREILMRHYEAIGGYERVKALKTWCLAGAVTHDGLEGRFRKWEQVPLRYRVEEDYGVIRLAHGDDGLRSWSRDANAKVVVQRDEETLKRRQIRRLLQEFDHMDPLSANFRLSWEGMEDVGGNACHVIRTVNRINADVTLDFINARTLLLEKSVLKQPDMTFHTRYGDYRPVGGVLYAFREETDILPREKRVTLRVDTFETGCAMDPARFAVPAADAADFRFTGPERSADMGFQLAENLIFLPVTVGGDTRPWVLDSAASMSVLDRDYAHSLGLEIRPGIKGAGLDGTFPLDFVEIPGFGLPGVRFEPQKIFCLQGLAARFHAPAAVGILGFDFLSRFVTRIDYAGQSLRLYDPEDFAYAGPGTVVDAPLQAKAFTLPMTVEDRYGGRWALDLGAHDVAFHFPYAQENGLFGRHGVRRAASDLGGTYLEHVVEFASASLGGFRVERVLIGMPEREGKGGNSARELVGSIGNSLLRHFVVFLDYSRQQVILERGRDFGRVFPRGID